MLSLMLNAKKLVLPILGVLATIALLIMQWQTAAKEDLKDEVIHYQIKEKANEVRSKPVPSDKRIVLDRM